MPAMKTMKTKKTTSTTSEVRKPLGKKQIAGVLAAKAGITNGQGAQVVEILAELIRDELKAGLAFALPGVCKLKAVARPATAAKQTVNPFTKEPMTVAAKPASTKVKATVLKPLKVAVAG
jgi:DNA-binding protein HU-beta